MSLAPFSTGYVLRITVKHLRKYIDLSIHKTFTRISDFEGDGEKSKEVLDTLMLLHKMRKLIDDFQSENSKHFKGA